MLSRKDLVTKDTQPIGKPTAVERGQYEIARCLKKENLTWWSRLEPQTPEEPKTWLTKQERQEFL